ncbi:hypothetical protein COY16_03855 [Candidatus Roizmanbacteria bacterium CG_4_10_14_0_2_um_filter_39_13]|uniref:Uncharacterized protein n=1 Tax=Candidatus Roizmanbacteria bacterium CG_4_10_14_0_2_um_filter_39_13 TaxID=1974825 RepID=A0A2M7TXR8_9BACT|nr:MAG: hypothetical protein COY16_03855 [Candidatus Roizmanbacteria bacterium CG_4_10_14_0_2_um_filter_39_13]
MIAKILAHKKMVMIALVVLLLLIMIGLYFVQKNPSTNPSSRVSPTPDLLGFSDIPKALTIDQIPRLNEDTGGGLDINSPEIQNSIVQVNNLKAHMPFQSIFTTSQGIEIEIFIPPADLQENDWTMTAHIFGIDYQVPKDSKDYQKMRLSFLEGAREVTDFVKEHGGEPQKLIIKWGDRYFIQDRAQEWLNSIDS